MKPLDPHEKPRYADFVDMRATSASHGDDAARQVAATTAPCLPAELAELDVLDLGSGYGDTAVALAKIARSVHAVEPMHELHREAVRRHGQRPNLTFQQGGVEDLCGPQRYDLVVLDNVFEHLPHQEDALRRIDDVLRPGGVVYLLKPNRLWPIEAHYRLPFLAWLPLRWATAYLRASRRGTDYTDASYARTSWTMTRLMSATGWHWDFVLPGAPDATRSGMPVHYRLGIRVLKRFPALWCISKSLLIVAVKPAIRTEQNGLKN